MQTNLKNRYNELFIPNITAFPSIPTPTPTIYTTPTLEATLRPDQYTTYASIKLGISFTYVNYFHNHTKEIGNTIYLYQNPNSVNEFQGTNEVFLKNIAPSSQYVTVFPKDSSETLKTAIERVFLKNYSLENCPIISYNLPKSDKLPSREAVQISVPKTHYETFAELDAAIKLCPPTYTVSGNGVSYFMMEVDHPNKFFFFHIGQSSISSGVLGRGTWDESLIIQ